MKKNDLKNVFIALAIIALFLYSENLFAQEEGAVIAEINKWRNSLKLIVQSVIGLCSLGGGLYSYFKVQTDDGGSGKKAIGNFLFALLFGSVLITIIEMFFPTR